MQEAAKRNNCTTCVIIIITRRTKFFIRDLRSPILALVPSHSASCVITQCAQQVHPSIPSDRLVRHGCNSAVLRDHRVCQLYESYRRRFIWTAMSCYPPPSDICPDRLLVFEINTVTVMADDANCADLRTIEVVTDDKEKKQHSRALWTSLGDFQGTAWRTQHPRHHNNRQ